MPDEILEKKQKIQRITEKMQVGALLRGDRQAEEIIQSNLDDADVVDWIENQIAESDEPEVDVDR